MTKYKSGDIVNTPDGKGVLKKRESNTPGSCLYYRWLVELYSAEELPSVRKMYHSMQAGLYFMESEMMPYKQGDILWVKLLISLQAREMMTLT